MATSNHRVGVSFGVTLNTGNYNSVKFNLSDEADIGDADSPLDERLKMLAELQTQAREIMSKIKAANKPEIPT